MFKDAKSKDPSLTFGRFLGSYLSKDYTEVILSLGIPIYLLTGNTILGFSVDFSNPSNCFVTGVMIPYLAVNIVLNSISVLPGVNLTENTRKDIRNQ